MEKSMLEDPRNPLSLRMATLLRHTALRQTPHESVRMHNALPETCILAESPSLKWHHQACLLERGCDLDCAAVTAGRAPGSERTLMKTKRSPVGPLLRPALPSPRTRSRLSVSTPAGTRRLQQQKAFDACSEGQRICGA